MSENANEAAAEQRGYPCDDTAALLARWRSGERAVLPGLLERHLEWVRRHVHKRLGGVARRDVDTGDIVQEVAVRVLENGPRFVLADSRSFRRLLARMVENLLTNEAKYQARLRRSPNRERRGADESVIYLQGERPHKDVTRPEERAQRDEEREWILLGKELLGDRDREIIHLHDWERHAFGDIGRAIGTTPDAARMRYQRAMQRLADYVVLLRSGKIEQALDESESESG